MLLFALTWEFWIIGIALAILIISSAWEHETHTLSIITVIAMFVALRYIGDFSLFAFIKENPGALWFLPGYFLAGAMWSVAKWYLFLTEKFAEVKQDWADWEKKGSWKPRETFGEYLKEKRPEASRHKDRIIYWINFWPVSIFWTFLREVFQKIGVRIYNSISKVYDRLGRRVFQFDEGKNGD